ncbi:MAG: SDR family oxidoreductase [Dehalococcoidia bacterium]|nr:MAG: SDR family oxidoreductase [Dehalococcoidia bacterium]
MEEEKFESLAKRFRLDGKVAIVTGGSRGIGRAIALGLAEAGADIVLTSRKLPDLEAVAKEVEALGREALPVAANIRHIEEHEAVVKATLDRFGHVDILVNNAGTNVSYSSVFGVDEKAWDITMGLNLKAVFFLTQRVTAQMRDQGRGGSVVNISSDSGFRPYLGMSVYAISKCAVQHLTAVFAQELGQYNIRCNCIAPSVTRTRLSEALWTDEGNRRRKEMNTTLGRIAEPIEMAGAALYLASEASSYMTGQTLLVDGGEYAMIQDAIKTVPYLEK